MDHDGLATPPAIVRQAFNDADCDADCDADYDDGQFNAPIVMASRALDCLITLLREMANDALIQDAVAALLALQHQVTQARAS